MGWAQSSVRSLGAVGSGGRGEMSPAVAFPGPGRLCFSKGVSRKVTESPRGGWCVMPWGRSETPRVLRTELLPLMVGMGWQNETPWFATFKKILSPKGSPSRNYLITKTLELIHIDLFLLSCFRARHLNPWWYIGGNGLFTHFPPPPPPGIYHTGSEKKS